MEQRLISAELSDKEITFRPGGVPAVFRVTVTNESDRLADFQIEVTASGAEYNPVLGWYRLPIEAGTKKPPGSVTPFEVSIVEAPIPGFVGVVNLIVRVFSTELRQERRSLLRLRIEPGAMGALLDLGLPVRRLGVYPRNKVEVPVSLRNLTRQPTEVIVRLLGLDPTWLPEGSERRVQLPPAAKLDVSFVCQPPSPTQALSQDYPFTVEATALLDGSVTPATGVLEVLPFGFVQFRCDTPKRQYPEQGGWLPILKGDPAAYDLAFKNTSNLQQQVEVQVVGDPLCVCALDPSDAPLEPGASTCLRLTASKPRPWIGLAQYLRLKTTAKLSDERLGSTDPASLTLELAVMPVIPPWLQLAILGLIAALVLLILSLWPAEGHTGPVRSVRFSGDGYTVLSGSDDLTIRRWRVQEDHLTADGVLAKTDKAIARLRYRPKFNDQVAAALENGEVDLWNVLNKNQQTPLKEFVYKKEDRVRDLLFTGDSKFLFVGIAQNGVLRWELPDGDTPPTLLNQQVLDFTNSAMVLAGANERTLVVAGNFNRLVLWDWRAARARPRRVQVQGDAGDGNYNQTLATVQIKDVTLLAMGDTQGAITLWNLAGCAPSTPEAPLICPVLARWKAHDSVLSLALSKDGHYLVSGGFDGRVVLWTLPVNGDYDLGVIQGTREEIERRSRPINSVDMIAVGSSLQIVSGGDDAQVKLSLHRLEAR
ncbi:WD40 repeat domain-containing protein [Anthocerotibacter panamensis]|uniref:hypothetical protein n=1 Tax=Anthocerotibacter panamensis TaxID=2857077 RepID=UPI001C406662|nr:hypothetical protein [Anthocerotibacter panamensis]